MAGALVSGMHELIDLTGYPIYGDDVAHGGFFGAAARSWREAVSVSALRSTAPLPDPSPAVLPGQLRHDQPPPDRGWTPRRRLVASGRLGPRVNVIAAVDGGADLLHAARDIRRMAIDAAFAGKVVRLDVEQLPIVVLALDR